MKIDSKSKKINKAWINDQANDPYVRLAKREGYRARAAYKLKEIDETLGLIRPGQVVVDLANLQRDVPARLTRGEVRVNSRGSAAAQAESAGAGIQERAG